MKLATDPIVPAGPEYRQFIDDLKTRIGAAQLSAARAVNRDLILLYWDIGRGIVEKQKLLGWGESVVEQLAKDLRQAFPQVRGFSAANIWRMRQLHQVCSSDEILAQVARELEPPGARAGLSPIPAQLVPESHQAEPPDSERSSILAQAVRELAAAVPWGHHVLLLGRIKSAPEWFFYLRATARFGWSRNVLLNQLKAQAYERAKVEKKTHNFPRALPEHLAEQANEMLKSTYNLEFLGLRRAVRERELEDRLISRLQSFLLELGYGFCFVGRQHRVALGKKEYFIDLLFYHRFLKALVAFDLHPVRYIPRECFLLRLRPPQQPRREFLHRLHARPPRSTGGTRGRRCLVDEAASAAGTDLLRSLPKPAGRHAPREVPQDRVGKTLLEVAIEASSHGVKVGPFEPEFAGKMDFYLNVLNDHERGPGDQPSIGIILCAEKDDVEVEYALRAKGNPIGVAAYTLQSKLPGELKGKLPTAKQLAAVLRTVLPERTS
jgi:predicted nuclease of restriction endonuclease-like (RecB) superfamily